jgi:lipopolysaccharide export system protein LptA
LSVVRAVVLATALAVIDPAAAAAQGGCDLRITAPTASSVGSPGGQGAYTTYLGGGVVTLRCGGAVMTGDSAVHYETEQRAEMVGGVDYRDATRTLTAARLTYYEPNGQVVAAGNVDLVRLATGARLSGPRVSFFRAGAGGAVGRTLATGRPHTVMPPASGQGPPIEVDSDEAEFIGDTVALARGNVTIGRIDFDATADSARFAGETGRLYGRPVVSARGMRLEGDSIHAGLASGGVDRLHAFGAARGEGESVELEAEEILILSSASDDEVERIEAYGGRALAAAEAFLIAGDSLDIRLAAGRPDSVTAVGRARSFQLGEPAEAGAPLAEPEPDLSEGASWIEGDTIRAWFEGIGVAPVVDEAGREEAGAGEASARIRRLRARGQARSYFAAVRDTARSNRPSRNYIIGRSIDIRFADGEPAEVTADQAIGVFLEPAQGSDPARPSVSGELP